MRLGGNQPKREPTGDYLIGYAKPPVEHQFKEGNPGGPGRPKGSKSQDTLLRAELSAKQTIRVGGCERTMAKREIAATLWVNGALEKRDFKHLTVVNSESRRLFPETSDVARLAAYDPAADRRALQQLMEHLALGEPDPAGGDPLADLSTGGPDLGQGGNGGAWDEGDWSSAKSETSDGD